MLRYEELGQAEIPGGGTLTLVRRGVELIIQADRLPLMSSRMHGSEEALATLARERLRPMERPRVLVGGLGMGFTLRAALDAFPEDADIVVAELVPGIVTWNRGVLGPLANHPLDDPRVTVEVGDVQDLLARSVGGFDAILLDVDNGPRAFTKAGNGGLYDDAGLARIKRALRPKGVLAVWSAWPDTKFERRMAYAGFEARSHTVRARLKQGGPRHTIFVGV
jgi:spermidine synthase